MRNITITVSDYDELLEAKRMLDALEAAGVDNWEGFEYAQEMFNES